MQRIDMLSKSRSAVLLTALCALSGPAVGQTVDPPPIPHHDLGKGGIRVTLSLPNAYGIATYHVEEQEISVE